MAWEQQSLREAYELDPAQINWLFIVMNDIFESRQMDTVYAWCVSALNICARLT